MQLQVRSVITKMCWRGEMSDFADVSGCCDDIFHIMISYYYTQFNNNGSKNQLWHLFLEVSPNIACIWVYVTCYHSALWRPMIPTCRTRPDISSTSWTGHHSRIGFHRRGGDGWNGESWRSIQRLGGRLHLDEPQDDVERDLWQFWLYLLHASMKDFIAIVRSLKNGYNHKWMQSIRFWYSRVRVSGCVWVILTDENILYILLSCTLSISCDLACFNPFCMRLLISFMCWMTTDLSKNQWTMKKSMNPTIHAGSV